MMRGSRRQAIRLAGGARVATWAAAGNRRRAGAAAPTPEVAVDQLFHDDFHDGLRIDGADARWGYFVVPAADGSMAFVGDDGEATSTDEGLEVRASGAHPTSGEPAFTSTVPQEHGDPDAVPGGVDHVKWLVYANATASTGFPGFDTLPGHELVFRATISGQTFGTAEHPFEESVLDPDDDLRLAAVALNTYDPESWMVYDFWLTNRGIYAFYERLPFGRLQLGTYAAFSFHQRVGDRSPYDWHDLEIAYNRSAGTVRWSVDGEEHLRVERIGYRIAREHMTIDHGGAEEPIESRQLNGGMGMFTLLDGALPSRRALVRLSGIEGTYFHPEHGEPATQVFVDETSVDGSRLFGQGARLRVASFTVENRKVAG